MHLTGLELSERALAWAATRADGPFFLYLQFMDPHAPYDAPHPDRPHGRGGGEPGLHRGHRWEDGSALPLVMGWDRLEGPAELEQFKSYYDEEVSYLDHCLGRLLATLRARGLLENTIVLVTSDHGEEFAEHGHWSHGYSLHREVLHVPLVVAAPGLGPRAGTASTHPVSLIDVVPTLVELAPWTGTACWPRRCPTAISMPPPPPLACRPVTRCSTAATP
jgi:arylsulfatase A-like enzyme